jgi:hypothetical protein
MSVRDDIGLLGLDGSEERVEIAAAGDELKLGLRLQQAPDALAHEVTVLSEDQPDRHRPSIRRYPTARRSGFEPPGRQTT